MNKLVSLLFFNFLLLSAFAQNSDQDQRIAEHRKGIIKIKAVPGSRVEIEQLKHEFWFGAAISNGLASNYWSANDQKMYREKFLENFNSAVTENAVKWLSMERNQDEVNYEVVDGILEWCDENGIPLRGHNVYWGIDKFVQPWLKEMNDEQLEKTLQARAYDIANRYKGRFVEYDLNNEMVHGNFYAERLGAGITKKMEDWFHEKDPEAKLWLNDYDILTGNKLEEYMVQIRSLLSNGVEIAGIGVQGHLHAEDFDAEVLQKSLDSLATFGLPIRITEFNMPGQRSKWVDNRSEFLTPEQELQKAQNLVDYYRICFSHPAVEGILMWGFWEGANWIPASGIYRKDWSPTPAADAYQNLIFNEWWTKASGTLDKTGVSEISAFYGDYRITIDGKPTHVRLEKEKGELVLDFTQN